MQTNQEQLREQVQRVALLRRVESHIGAQLDAAKAAFNAEHAAMLTESARLASEREQAEDVLSALALAQFAATGDKHPTAGVDIAEMTKLEYDAVEAFAWASEKGMAVKPASLDVKAFEKIAKATKLDFVNVVVEPKVTIARDLSAVLDAPVQQAAA